MSKTKSRRLRKKLYLDEFAMYGFTFSCNVKFTSNANYELLHDQFLAFIENRKLCMGGNFEGGFICSENRYQSATREDIEAIFNWLSSNNSLSTITVGRLIDANYDV